MGGKLLLTLRTPVNSIFDTIFAVFSFRTDSPAPYPLSLSALLLDKIQPIVVGLTVIIVTDWLFHSICCSANIEITRVRKSNESEIAVMKAALKKEQTKTASLEKSLQQKVSGS